ncbi:MAG: hypothetical protein HDR17_14610 [Lachnospiraceae bacterium]|nr:hypothetical protein [Lachnospiraceae bacterium]
MKKVLRWIACITAVIMLAGCGNADGTKTDGATEYVDTSAENIKQAGLGAMALLYDDSVWTYDETQGGDTGLAFTSKDGSLLGISCSRESFYQHPLDMLNISRQIWASYAGYEEVEEPTVTSVQGEEWYEWVCKYEENGVTTVALQRFYGKNYYAYTMSYIAEEKLYEANKSEALKVMNSATMSVPGNDEAEEKAKEFLVGEWDLGDQGYLVMNEDGTYFWYMNSSKDEKNMHKGVYHGDVTNDAVGFKEGEGIYFVLFPEVLYVDGKEGQTSSAKYDYAVSMTKQDDGTYQMLNPTTFALYSMLKQE